MKKLPLAPLVFVPLAVLFSACGLAQPEVIVVTATPPPETAVPVPTLAPTNTPLPTSTPEPTPSPAPTWEPVAMGSVEAALREQGYRRFPFINDDGFSGFYWIKDNSYEQVTTSEDGAIELQVLHDTSASARAARMERHLDVLDDVLSPGFMAQLRQEHTAYNQSLASSVTGEPDEIIAYGDEWQTVWAEYNAT